MHADRLSSAHDVDFQVGKWHVSHHRLAQRLVGSRSGEDFSGHCVMRPLLGGSGNIEDNVIDLPAGSYRAVALRSFDQVSLQWSIWWLDSRNPRELDTPVRGSFTEGVGAFFAQDTFQGRPIKVRFIWLHITPASARWEQAFSADDGETWEANWIMDFQRIG